LLNKEKRGDIVRIIRTPDYAEMSRKAAGIIAAEATLNPGCVLGLATGDSPLGVYGVLAEWCGRGLADFSGITVFNLDEYRGIAPGDARSYRFFMRENLFSKINIRPENVFIPDGLAADPAAECERYETEIDKRGGFDLQLLGIGHNGHIGFNEPGDEFIADTHLVDLSENTVDANRRFFDKRGDVPVQAYTMGIRTIMKARKILLIVTGEKKADIVKRAFYGGISPSVPASVLQLHNDFTLVGDEAALSQILK
jgi:glucosamine-6-phosphate deaminase